VSPRLAASDIPAGPVVGLMAIGFLVALGGHVVRSYRVVGIGLAILFVATALMVVLGFTAYQDDPGDPRPGEDYSKPF